MPDDGATFAEFGGRTLRLTNLDKVLYLEAGWTKADVISYAARIAPTMVAHTAGRCMTLRRWPDGVGGESFFEKRCPKHRPEWVPVAVGPGDRRGNVEYCRFEEPAAFAWAANLAALELHAPMARSDNLDNPLMAVFDLDPGEGVGMAACAEVGLELRDMCAGLDLQLFAKTSGSKGLQCYLPLNSVHTHEQCSQFALAAGQVLAKRHPQGVLTEMRKADRAGKVFVDWSQNSHHKTTVCVYSLRAKSRPTVSTPVTWDEVELAAAGSPLSFEAPEVLERVERLGDLFEPTVTLRQQLPKVG